MRRKWVSTSDLENLPPLQPLRLRVDDTCGDPDAAALRATVRAGDWGAVVEAVASDDDPHRRAFLVSQIGMAAAACCDSRPDDLEKLVKTRRRKPRAAAFLVRGSYDVQWAWALRGWGRARTIPAEVFSQFDERLRRGEQDLLEAARLDEPDATPWVQLLMSGRGLEVDKSELVARFTEAEQRTPGIWSAHAELLQGLCAKWAGSHQQMFDFAHRSSSAAPPGSPLHALTGVAHFERIEAIEYVSRERASYLAHPDVRTEIERAGQLALAGGQIGSTPSGRLARDTLGYIAGVFGVDSVAVPLLQDTRDSVTPGIWWADPKWSWRYSKMKALVLGRTGRS